MRRLDERWWSIRRTSLFFKCRRLLHEINRGCVILVHRSGKCLDFEFIYRPQRTLLDNCALRDRKSTRLNSSHGYISYAVFCLKKKKQMTCASFDTDRALGNRG